MPTIWTIISVLINIGILAAAIWTARAAVKSATAAEHAAHAARDVADQGWVNQREYWVDKVSKAIKACRPTNNINQAGLPVARVVDAMPSQFSLEERQAIVRDGFHRAGLQGPFQFHQFWRHLCEIQGWPLPPDIHPTHRTPDTSS